MPIFRQCAISEAQPLVDRNVYFDDSEEVEIIKLAAVARLTIKMAKGITIPDDDRDKQVMGLDSKILNFSVRCDEPAFMRGLLRDYCERAYVYGGTLPDQSLEETRDRAQSLREKLEKADFDFLIARLKQEPGRPLIEDYDCWRVEQYANDPSNH